MTRIFIADSRPEEISALRLLIADMFMDIAGESNDWYTTLLQANASRADIFLLDRDLLPTQAARSLQDLRRESPGALIILIFSHPDLRQQAILSSDVYMFISKNDPPERIADRLRLAAAKVSSMPRPENR